MKRLGPYLLSALSGILLSLPWLLTGFGWLMLIAFVPLLIAEEPKIRSRDTQSLSFIFLLGFIAFLSWNIISTWWIAYVSLTGMLLITAINSLIMSSVWWGRAFVHKRLGAVSGYFSLIVFWIAFEFLHHNWTIRWPWLTLGNGLANSVKIIQWYEYSGVLGGSLWILLCNVLIFISIKKTSGESVKKSAIYFSFTLIVLLLPIFGSLARYYSYSEKVSICRVVVLQPNIDPFTEKFSERNYDHQVRKLVELANSSVTSSTNFVLAPETAFPDCWEDSLITGTHRLKPVYEFLSKYPDISFIAGTMTKRKIKTGEVLTKTARHSADGNYYFDIFNSALLFDKSFNVQICHKSILVSGVEKMPFQEYFSFLKKYLIDLGGASGSLAAASEPEVFLDNGKAMVGPVICFESAFGAQSAALVRKGANILFVLTNDGWWRESPGALQHFSYSRIRAIETRRSVARSANTGISGFINQRGDVLQQTEMNACTAIGASLQTNNEISFYVKNGDVIGRICLLISVLIIAFLIILGISNRN